MTSNERGSGPADRPRPSSDEGRPESFATQIQRIATQRPPPPPGKGIAMMVIAAAVVLAIIWQLTLGSDIGPGGVIEDFHRDDPSKIAAPRPTGEASSPAAEPEGSDGLPRRVVLEEVGGRSAATPIPLPGPDLPLPPGIDARTEGRLRLNLHALASASNPDGAPLVALSALRELPYVVREAPAASRPAVAKLVVDYLVLLLGRPGLGVAALDAGLVMVEDDPTPLDPLITAAANRGLADDETAAAALLFLDALAPDARLAHRGAVEGVRDDAERPAHLRRLARQLLASWGAE